VLTNDVVCFALTPLLAAAVVRAGLPPLPYLLGLACATNLGSALTPIGNPQNILIAQRLGLPFLPFVLACAPAVVASLAILYWLLARTLRGAAPGALPAPAGFVVPPPVPLDRREAAKAIALTAAAIALFLSPVPAALTALAVGGVVLTSRKMHSRSMLALVDWHLLALFCGLFVVNRGLELGGWTEAARGARLASGVDLARPAVLVTVVAGLGTLVGNVPAVMLLLRFIPAEPLSAHGVALASTFAGNAVLFGSIANLIVAEQAARLGLGLGLREHLRVGLPITLASLGLAALSLALG
jgi:Na+/H+ antiporter NhaD/arsenite permease-like protein